MPGDFAHCIEHSLIRYAPAAKLGFNHPVTRFLKVKHLKFTCYTARIQPHQAGPGFYPQNGWIMLNRFSG
jgi:hypothetical protein